jgi:hypothetical protein
MTLQTQIKVDLIATLRSQLDLVESQAPHAIRRNLNLVDGDGLNEADRIYSDRRTLNGSAAEELDLGALTDPLGDAVVLGHIKGLFVAPSGGAVAVGGHASGPAMFGDASDEVLVRDGGFLLLAAPDATGYAVTADTGDLLQVSNQGAATITYDIVIVGAA